MSIKLANNAIAHLAASLSSTDTTAVIVPAEAGSFPTLSAGEWHPMTIMSLSGEMEIVKVTNRSSNILTIERGFDGTAARDFSAGDRAEIRMTAAVVETLQSDLVGAKDELTTLLEDGDAVVTAAMTAAIAAQSASLTTSLRADMDSKNAALTTTLATLMDTKDAAQQVVVDAKDTALHSVVTSEIAIAKSSAVAQAEAYSDAALASAVATLTSAINAQAPKVGDFKMWLQATAPSGWVFCYGQALSRTTFVALFAEIGTIYGAGDGSTTFNVPDLRGTGLIGKDNMGGTAAGRVTTAGSSLDGATLGARGGTQNHTLTSAQIPAHAHPVTDPGHLHTSDSSVRLPSSGNNFATYFAGGTGTVPSNTATTGITVGNTGGGGTHNNMQPSLVVQFIIKT